MMILHCTGYKRECLCDANLQGELIPEEQPLLQINPVQNSSAEEVGDNLHNVQPRNSLVSNHLKNE